MNTAYCHFCASPFEILENETEGVCPFCGAENRVEPEDIGAPDRPVEDELERLELGFNKAMENGDRTRFLDLYRRYLILALRQVPGHGSVEELNAQVEARLDRFRDPGEQITISERTVAGPNMALSGGATWLVLIVGGVVLFGTLGKAFLGTGEPDEGLRLTSPAFLVTTTLAVLFGVSWIVSRVLRRKRK
jgi:hypothetical protein